MHVAACELPRDVLDSWKLACGIGVALQLSVPSLSVALSTFVEVQQGQY
jgi:hypothetical protein